MQSTYGIILGLILLGVCVSGSVHIFRNSEKTPRDVFQLIIFIASDIFIGGTLIVLFFLGR